MSESILKSSEDRICESCPMQQLDEQQLEKGVANVLGAEAEDRSIGVTTTELGLAVNACRMARFNDTCSNLEQLGSRFEDSNPVL